MKIRITGDVFDICHRLKEIDGGYYIEYNLKNNKYEVHSQNQRQNTYCLTLPFDSLDARAVDYVLKTRIENMEKIIKEMEQVNEKVKSNVLKTTKDRLLNF